MATFLLLLCIGAGCAVIGILFMLYGPTSSGVLRVRTASPASVPMLGFTFAPPPPPPAPTPAMFAPEPFVPVAHSLSTDFSAEEPVREVRIRAKSPSPPPLPPVTPLPPPPLPKAAQTKAPPPIPQGSAPLPPTSVALPPTSAPPPLPPTSAAMHVPFAPMPKAAQTIAPAPLPAQTFAPKPLRAEATPTTPPRLGVSAPSARARHLEPPRRMPAPMPRSRVPRGSDAPPVRSFATDQQRTVPREREDFLSGEHTFVD